jgi:hypothetical protein
MMATSSRAQVEEVRPADQQLTEVKPGARAFAGALAPGQVLSFQYSGVTVPTLFTGDYSSRFTLGTNVTGFTVEVDPSSPSTADIGIYVRRGTWPTIVSGSTVSDYRMSDRGIGKKTLRVTSASPLPAGDYYVALLIYSPLLTSIYGTMKLTLEYETGCTFTITSSLASGSRVQVGSGAANGSITVSTGTGCAWTASSNVTWIRFLSTPSGSGPGTVQFAIDANTGGEREGIVTIGGKTIAFVQDGVQSTGLRSGARILSQFVAGATWTTMLYLTNLSTTASESYSVDFYRSDGSRMQISMNGAAAAQSLNGTLRAGEAISLTTTETGSLNQGWAAVYGGSNVAGFAVFRQSSANADQEAAVPLVTQPQRKFVMLYSVRDSQDTGLAVVNPTNSFMRVQLDFRQMDGRAITQQSIDLPPLGHTAVAIGGKWPALCCGDGVVTLTSDSSFSVLGLRFGFRGNAFTSFEPFLAPGLVR